MSGFFFPLTSSEFPLGDSHSLNRALLFLVFRQRLSVNGGCLLNE